MSNAKPLKPAMPLWRDAPEHATHLYETLGGVFIWTDAELTETHVKIDVSTASVVANPARLQIVRSWKRPKIVTYIHVGRDNTYSIEGEYSYQEVIKFLNQERIAHKHTVVLIEYKDESNLPKN